MKARWAVTIPLGQSLSAGSMRLNDGIEAHVDSSSELLWIRGSQKLHQDRQLDVQLRVLPEVKRYSVNSAGQLFPHGRRLPNGLLPNGPWRSLDSLLILQPQVAALAGQAPSSIPIRLIRSQTPEPCSLILTKINALVTYAQSAPQCRLLPLQFAMNNQGQALILGQPLPSIPGDLFARNGCVAYPAGFQLTPKLDQTSLQIILCLVPGDLALFSEDGQFQIVPEHQCLPVTRANVIASLRGTV